jgi:Tfp pilus assembly protein PilX
MKQGIRSPAMQSAKRQSGTVLIVVIMLLLLASVMTFFALNVGVFEQHTSGNDLKAKTVQEMADAGLSQGAEYLRQHSSYLTNTSKWTACTASDTSFPCGSVPLSSRRSTMYYFSGGGYDFDQSGGAPTGWETKMLPIDSSNAVTTAGNGFGVNYGVGAVLCRVAYKATVTAPTTCTDSASASPTSIVTLVSVASVPGEGARSTVTQSIGSYSIVGNLAGQPPILASGSVDLTGTLQIVTNPNSAGTGVPVSVWTRKNTNKTGTPNTCYYNEFLRNSSGSANGTIYTDSGSPNFPLCDNCNCAGSDSLSYDTSGNKQTKGIDILDGTGGGANSAVTATEFPCDLFQQIFSVQAWQDVDGDGFCEKKIMTTYKNPNTGVSVTMGVDEAYLFTNAQTIIPSAATTAANLATSAQLTLPGTYPSSAYSGLVWCQTGCNVGSNTQMGTATNPVLLVVDGSFTNHGTIFGMVFVRSLDAAGNTLTPAAGYTMSSSVIANGGNATLDMAAGAVVYGSVVVQGIVSKANGTSAVVYNKDVLTNLVNNPKLTPFGGVSGSWTDRTSY